MTTKYWPNLFRLDNKIIIVTGAGLIGKEVIRGIAEVGAKVIISEINEEIGNKLENELKNNDLDAIFVKTDIGSEKSIDNLINFCISEFKRIDGLVNTAFPRTKDWGEHEQLFSFNSWKKNIDMQLGGYYLTSIKVAEIMKKQKQGNIVNFGSISGAVAPDFSIYEGTKMVKQIPYAVIKAGVHMLAKYLAAYYGKYNVRSNVIAPGGVFDNQPEPFLINYCKKTPMGRMANPEDIVGPVIFLLSDASSYVNGHILMVDGGWTIW